MKAQEEIYLDIGSGVLVTIAYIFTLLVVIHNVFRYLCPMRINKPLITLFYVFVTIKLLAVLASIICTVIQPPSEEFFYSPLWYVLLVN